MNFYVFLATGFEMVEALGVVDILKRGQVDVYTVSVTNCRDVYSSHDVKVTTDFVFNECDFSEGSGIYLPGGLRGVQNLECSAALSHLIDAYAAQGKLMTALCAAPAILGHHRLLAGRHATCYPGFEEELYDALCSGAAVEVDENYITGIGMGKTIEFALEVLAHLTTKENAQRVAESIMFVD